jgi:hypothetical protein
MALRDVKIFSARCLGVYACGSAGAAGAADVAGAAARSTAWPQLGQKRAPCGNSAPQPPHIGASGAPHAMQNRAPDGFSCRHFEQDGVDPAAMPGL